MCEECGREPCTCQEQWEAYLALYGDEYCQRCSCLLSDLDLCPVCDRWDDEPDQGDDDDDGMEDD